ncbi:GNAT family N-acetyltransferase [Streptomyces sp. NPDC004051]
MRIIDVASGGPLLEEIYGNVLRPSFTLNELSPYGEITEALAHGRTVVTAVLDDKGRPMGAAVGEWSPKTGVLLLAYIAVRPEWRSRRCGALLMDAVRGAWRKRFQPSFILVEFEHPLAHRSDAQHGDPRARFRFYARHGVRALGLPYFQPSLGSGRERVYGMVLAAVHVAPTGTGGHVDTVASAPIREFLTDYFLRTEGEVPTDPAGRRLWRALEHGDAGISLIGLTDPAILPVSRPE